MCRRGFTHVAVCCAAVAQLSVAQLSTVCLWLRRIAFGATAAAAAAGWGQHSYLSD